MTPVSRRPVAEQGWDSHTELVDEEWIERTPRRAAVRAALAVEARLMARISARLPLSVPVPAVVPAGDALPWRLRHLLVPGEPVEPGRLDARDGERVGAFLRVLHDLPFDLWGGAGLSERDDLPELLERMRSQVLPLLPAAQRPVGAALLERCAAPTPVVLVHGDLGPAHLLATGCCVTGVIDWTDAALADPALDLAWALHGTPAAFADALAETYGVTAQERARAHDWHRLGPWFEVLHGLDEPDPSSVTTGTAGVLDRLG